MQLLPFLASIIQLKEQMTDIDIADPVSAPSPAEQAILSLVRERGPDKTICPSEAARVLGGSPHPDSCGAGLCIRCVRQQLCWQNKALW